MSTPLLAYTNAQAYLTYRKLESMGTFLWFTYCARTTRVRIAQTTHLPQTNWWCNGRTD